MIKSKPIQLIILFTIFSINLFANNKLKNYNPNFEFTGVNEFYMIVDILKQNKEPSKKQWERLFETPGYKRLSQEIPEDFFRKLMIVSYMSGKDKEKEKILVKMSKQENKFWEMFTINSYKAFEYSYRNREEIIETINELKTYPYTERAVTEALNFLPESSVTDYPFVSFIIFPDSRGYIPICIAINNKLKEKKNLSDEIINKLNEQGYSPERISVLGLAHEFFHYYRDKELDFKMPERNSDEFDLIWILNQIENEGIADQIDQKQLYFGKGCFVETEIANLKLEEQKKQPDMIRKLDSLLIEFQKNPIQRKTLGQRIRHLPSRSGHPLGFYMANIIEEQFGKKELVNVVRNPFAFFKLYNSAAKQKSGVPVFSNESITLIIQLEKKYLKKSK